MTDLLLYNAACSALAAAVTADEVMFSVSRSCVKECRMSKKDFIAQLKQVSDLLHESTLAATILRYAIEGHATPLMIEQAIVLVDKQIVYGAAHNDQEMIGDAAKLKAKLQQALVDGVESLRVVRGPGREFLQVEEPLARVRMALGHKLRRQVKCAGGVIDIYDLTADELIECKYSGTSAALGEAAGQLSRYRKSFPGAALAIAVLVIEPEAQWLADVLRQQGIAIIELCKGPPR